MNRRFALAFLFFAFALCGNTFAQNQDTVKRTIDSINERLVMRDYEKAYSYALFLVKIHKTSEMSAESVSACEQAVDFRSQDLFTRQKWKELVAMADEISGAPLSVQAKAAERIAFAQRETMEESKRLAAAEAAAKKSKALAEAKKKAAEKEAEKKKADQTAIVGDGAPIPVENSAVVDGLIGTIESLSEDAKDSRRSLTALMAVCALLNALSIAVAVACLIIVNNGRSGRTAGGQSVDILQSGNSPRGLRAYLKGAGEKDSGGFRPAADPLEAVCATMGQEELDRLYATCSGVGERIDAHTGRKNDSAKVSSLAYALALKLGFSQKVATLCAAAVAVRDFGFLGIDSELFVRASLGEEGRAMIERHADGMIPSGFLVDGRCVGTFADVIASHHENADGTGYPRGIKGAGIPVVARIARVAESYVAMTSVRAYRPILDSHAALGELRACAKRYDQKVLDAIEAIV